MRTGIIAKKIGMSNLYTQSGVNIPVTVLHIDQCQIIERVDSTDTNADKVLVGACKLKKAFFNLHAPTKTLSAFVSVESTLSII